MKGIRRKAAILIGLVFLLSGLLKLMDPVGTMLIVTEYLKFFKLAFLLPVAKGLGVVLSLVESLVGAALVTGVWRRVVAIITWSLLGFFTLVTLVLWIKNPAMDCGCFGEAIHLTHGQTLLKNMVLVLFSLLAFLPLKSIGQPKPRKWGAFATAALLICVTAVYSLRHLPILEFTSFATGAQLYASLPDDAEPEAWQQAPMLSFSDAQGHYLDSVAVEGRVVVFSVYDAPKANMERLYAQMETARAAGATPLLLSSAYPSQEPAYFSDYKTLVTLNRSNGGASYFYNGELICRWDAAHVPASFSQDLQEDPPVLSNRQSIRRRLRAEGFVVLLAAILLLI